MSQSVIQWYLVFYKYRFSWTKFKRCKLGSYQVFFHLAESVTAWKINLSWIGSQLKQHFWGCLPNLFPSEFNQMVTYTCWFYLFWVLSASESSNIVFFFNSLLYWYWWIDMQGGCQDHFHSYDVNIIQQRFSLSIIL